MNRFRKSAFALGVFIRLVLSVLVLYTVNFQVNIVVVIDLKAQEIQLSSLLSLHFQLNCRNDYIHIT